MLRLTQTQRELLADKVGDIGNLITGAIVIGFLIGDDTVSAQALLASVTLWVTAMLVAILMAGGRR